MSDMSVAPNFNVTPNVEKHPNKFAVKKKWTKDEVHATAVATSAAAVGGFVLGKGLVKGLSIAVGLASLGWWTNYNHMIKNNIDVLDYSA